MRHAKGPPCDRPVATALAGAGALLFCVLHLILLTACTPAKDRRTFGTTLDDQTVEFRVIDALYSRPEFGEQDHIKVEAHNSTLLLAGETRSAANKALATEIAAGIKTVERVVNELEVTAPADTSGRMHNGYMTAKVNTRLMTANVLPGFDPGRIKVISARGNIYLMGTVTRAEGDAVTEVVRQVRGVNKVVRVFDYTD
jgi:osmotically-inducible protein OsmY